MIRVLLAEDQTMMRGALAQLLDLEPDLEVVAQVGTGEEVVDAARRTRADIALLDIELPGISGIAVARDLRDRLPGVVSMMVTTYGHAGYVRDALDAGARGFMVKDGPVEELAVAIRRVVGGTVVVDPDLAREARQSQDNPLSPREREVLAVAARGAPSKEIAAQMFLSVRTVRNHLSAAITKTQARNRLEAVNTAREHGWI